MSTENNQNPRAHSGSINDLGRKVVFFPANGFNFFRKERRTIPLFSIGIIREIYPYQNQNLYEIKWKHLKKPIVHNVEDFYLYVSFFSVLKLKIYYRIQQLKHFLKK